MTQKGKKFKRWYDHDPLLLEVIDMLRFFKEELKLQAEVFMSKIELQVEPEIIDKFYNTVKPYENGTRWYDTDELLSKTIELLRVVPPEAQRKAAAGFLEAMEQQGITPEVLRQAAEEEKAAIGEKLLQPKDYTIPEKS
ncbi:MAG: hypothetical protein AB7V50_07425 [Vampirovibrionia bacterium]